MDIKGKRTRKGEYVKFIFDDMEDYQAWISFFRHSFDRTDDSGEKYYESIESFTALVEKMMNPSDSYEEGRPTVTFWPDKMFYMAVAFQAITILFVKFRNEATAELGALYRAQNETLKEESEYLEKLQALVGLVRQFVGDDK